MPTQTGSFNLGAAKSAASGAINYITEIDSGNGIKVHAANNANSNYAQITANGMDVYKGGSNVASFGTETIIRTSDGTQLAYFGYGDTAGSEGASATAPFYSFGKTVPPVTPFPSWISGSNYKRGDIIVYNQLAYISTVNKTNDTIIPPNNDNWVRILIHPSVDKGSYSFVTGYGTRALSYASHAEGGNSTNGQGVYNTYTTAAGYSSHAEGEDVMTIGARSHAEGYGTTTVGDSSHAEGLGCYAGGEASHAEGYVTEANGDYSHAQNYITKANYDYQTVIGQWNSNQSDTAFEIGNGTDVTHLSNAFTVDWKGNVRMYLDSNGTSSADATSGTDKELFNAIRALGWYSDVIV